MYCSMPGLPVHHWLPELTQTYVHCIGDAIQPTHSLSSPSSPALNLSQHQSLFKWVSSSHQVTKVLALQIQYPFFQWKLRDDCFRMTDLVSVLSKGLSRVFCSTTVWKHQFFGIQPYDPTLTSIHDYWKNHSFDCRTFVGKVISLLFNTMSRFIIAFLPRSKRLLILWLQSLSAVILEPKKIKSAIDSTFSPFIRH